MKELDKIEKVFRDRLKDHSSPVDPAVWSQVSQSLGQAGAAGASSGSSFFGSLLGKAIVLTTIVAIVTGAVYILKPDTVQKTPEAKIELKNNDLVAPKAEDSDSKAMNQSEALEKKESPSNESSEITKQNVAENRSSEMTYEAEVLGQKELTVVEQVTQSLDVKEPRELGTEEYESTPIEEPSHIVQEQKPETREDLTFEFKKHSSTEDLVVSFSQKSKENTYYMWDFGDGYESDQESPEHVYEEEGVYTVTLREFGDGFSQETEIEIEVYLDAEIFIPNIFTPNHDHLNQTFDVLSLSKNVIIGNFEIYDQNSNLLFKSNDPNTTWNGDNLSGEPCAQGYYLFHIQFVDNSGKVIGKSGQVWLGRS